MTTTDSYHSRFEKLVSKLETKLNLLKQENQQLRSENESLKNQSNNGDLFNGLVDNERAAMRQHIQTMIERIEQHLPE